MSAVEHFMTGTYAVTQESPGSRDAVGLWIPGSTSVVNLDCVVQPLRGRDLENLPEGKHASDLRKIYCDTELRTVSEDSGRGADRIVIGGDTYEIVTSETWVSGATGRAYWKALAARIVGS